MKTMLGYLAILLGGAGTVLALAAGALAWPAASAVKEQSEEVAARADEGLAHAKDALARVDGRVTATAKAVETVRSSAARVAEGKAGSEAAAKIKALLTALGPLLERADSLGESLRSVSATLETAARLTERIGKDKARAERLRSIADRVGDGAKALGSLREDIDALQRGDAAPTARAIADLAARIGSPLEQFAGRLAEFRQEVDGAQDELARLRTVVAFWTTTGPVILDVLLAWFALGQLCLIGWGRRQLAARASKP